MSDGSRDDGAPGDRAATERALTVRDVAAEYGVAGDTVYRWIKSGRLSAIKLPGGGYRFRREHLAAFDESCSTPPATTAPVAMSDLRRDAFEVGRRMSAAKRPA
jgi:excisionase family DNA binding protein